MNAREQRGIVIAAVCKLKKTAEGWLVPSQTSGTLIYKVSVESQSCTCPDHRERKEKCKHLWAAEITMKRECCADGTVIDTQEVVLTERKTYKQDWPAYNRGQAIEKRRFQVLLHELCRNLPDRPCRLKGRRPHSVGDCVFAMTFQVYSGLSSRRFSSDLVEAQEKGYTAKVIPGLKMPQFFEDEYFTPILSGLIAHSATPLRSVETEFAVDSSGFGSSKFERWYDKKFGVTRMRAKWIKAHISCGTKTHCITAAEVLPEFSADAPQMVPLIAETARSFAISRVSADKAYGSLDNFEGVANLGAQAFIPFKEGTTGCVGGMFQRAFHLFQADPERYMEHYHRRSNVESVFSAVKRKFGDSVRSKTDTAMTNEVLCKFLAHNIAVLVMEQETLGIAPVFWPEENAAIEMAER